MSVKLLTEHHLEFLSLTGSCRGSSESTHVKMPHCWESHVMAHLKKKFILLHTLRSFIKHRFTFIHLKKGDENFYREFVLAPTHKAANNVVVV